MFYSVLLRKLDFIFFRKSGFLHAVAVLVPGQETDTPEGIHPVSVDTTATEIGGIDGVGHVTITTDIGTTQVQACAVVAPHMETEESLK